jgi:RNA polymerase sigma-70 factor (ECF subfamily)
MNEQEHELFQGVDRELIEPDRQRKIISRILGGDNEAFAPVVEIFGPAIHAFIARLTGNREAARDLTQETFLRAFSGLARFDPAKPLAPWLYRIALNLIRDQGRSTKRKCEQCLDSLPDIRDDQSPDPVEHLEFRQDHKALESALRLLPVDFREALTLRYSQDLPFAQVAAVLDISEAAAKMRVYRGLERLRTLLNSSSDI